MTVDLATPPVELPAWALPEGVRQADPGVPVAVDRAALVAFTAAALARAGARRSDALTTAETLVLSDARGHPSHGLSRLRQYLRQLDAGAIDGHARHEVLARRSAIEAWDAHHGLGPAVAYRAMARAITKARRSGLAAITVRDAGHFGMAGAYVLRALDAGMIGLTLCNTDPQVRPTGGRVRGIGTNPIAVGAPDGQGRGILLDMATSVVALGKVEVAKRAGRPIPDGWAHDSADRPTSDPDAALTGMLLPLGGEASTAGYKGYGLASIVAMLTGVLAGGIAGLAVPPLWDTQQPVGSSQFHLVIDPALVGGADAFHARLAHFVEELKGLPRQADVDEILVAGELEWRADERARDRVGLLPSVLLDLATMAVERRLLRSWRRVVAG